MSCEPTIERHKAKNNVCFLYVPQYKAHTIFWPRYIVQEEASEGHNDEFINQIWTQSPVYFLLAKHDTTIQSLFRVCSPAR